MLIHTFIQSANVAIIKLVIQQKKYEGVSIVQIITCTNHLKMQLLPGLCISSLHWQNQQQC